MSDNKTIYTVTYSIYNDKDTEHTFVFTDESEADKFKDYLEDRCKEKNIPVDIDNAVDCIMSYDYAVSCFEEQICDEEDWL